MEEKEVGGNGAEKKEKNDKQTSRSGNAAIKTEKKKIQKNIFLTFIQRCNGETTLWFAQ